MTPPHIEKAARAMKRTEIKKMVSGILSPASIDAHVDASWKTCIPAATLVWSLARAHTIEDAAKVGERLAAEMEAEMRTASLSGDAALRERAASVRSGANTCVYRIRALAVEG